MPAIENRRTPSQDLQQALTKREERFIRALAQGVPEQDALVQAGYSPKTQAADVLRRPEVARGLVAALELRVLRLQGPALLTLQELIGSADEDRVRREAARDLLELGPLGAERSVPAPVVFNIDIGTDRVSLTAEGGGKRRD